MKKTKIDAIAARAAKKINEVNRALKEIYETEQNIKELECQATEAANSGEFERYKALTVKRDDAQKELFVKQNFLNTLKESRPADNEIQDAWKEFASDYDRQFDKLLSDYESKRKAMLAAYGALVDLQGEALTIRKDLLKNAGVLSASDFNNWNEMLKCKMLPHGTPYDDVKVRMEGTDARDPDAVFYMARYEMEHGVKFRLYTPETERIRFIIAMRAAPHD